MVVAFRFCCCRSCRSVVDSVQLPRQHAKPTNQYTFLVTQVVNQNLLVVWWVRKLYTVLLRDFEICLPAAKTYHPFQVVFECQLWGVTSADVIKVETFHPLSTKTLCNFHADWRNHNTPKVPHILKLIAVMASPSLKNKSCNNPFNVDKPLVWPPPALYRMTFFCKLAWFSIINEYKAVCQLLDISQALRWRFNLYWVFHGMNKFISHINIYCIYPYFTSLCLAKENHLQIHACPGWLQ